MVFEDFIVPDPVVLVPLLAAAVIVGALLVAIRPPVTAELVFAFVPWMILGALLHVIYQMHRAVNETLLPDTVDVLFSAPSIYVTTAIVGGIVWLLAVVFTPSDERTRQVGIRLAGVGGLLLVPVVGVAGWHATEQFTIDPVLPIVGLLLSLVVTAGVYGLLGLWRPYAVIRARYIGALLLFAHVFDAITTAIGIELLDAGERSTAPQFILDVAAELPTAEYLGEAWLFILVKIIIASAIVVLFSDYPEERPTEGYLFFGALTAVGLGPGAHNFFLFFFGVG